MSADNPSSRKPSSPMADKPWTAEAEELAEAVLKAAGSALRHYMPASQVAILKVAQSGLDASRAALRQSEPATADKSGETAP